MRRIIFESSYQGVWQHLLEGLTFFVRETQAEWELHCLTLPEFLREISSRPDGALCVLGPDQADALDQIRRSGVPAVNMHRFTSASFPTVMSDNVACGDRAAEYLLSRGFRNFAFLGVDREWSDLRGEGFRRRISAAGYPLATPEQPLHVDDFRQLDNPAARRRLREWLTPLPRPLAVFAAADFISRTCLHACLAMGLHVPEDVALLGVDNEITICELAPVSLSSIPQNLRRMGFEAARMLDGIIAGRRRPSRPLLVPPADIIVRRSTDIFAFDDPHVAAALRIIHATPVADLSMKHVTHSAGVSRQWLDRRFKDLLGKTVSHVIRDVRLQRASLLLATSHLPIREVAKRCGFTRGENFTRFFRNATGSSPAGYRVHQQLLPPAPSRG